MDTQEAFQCIRQTTFFSDIDPAMLQLILQDATILSLQAHETLIQQNEPFNDLLYIILSGEFLVYRDKKLILKLNRPGQILGEMSIFTHEPRSAEVIAEVPSEVVAIHPQNTIAFLTILNRVLIEKIKLTNEKAKLYEDALLETKTVEEYSEELKREIKQRLKQIKLYSEVIEHNQNAVVICSSHHQIQLCNKAFTLLFGYHDLEAQDLSINQLFEEAFEIESDWQGEKNARKKDQTSFPAFVSMTPIRTVYALEFRDLTLQKQAELSAITDGLTSVFNRRYYDQFMLNQLLKAEVGGYTCSVILLDIDHFKIYNDTHGHQFGDQVLQDLARVLKQGVRQTDMVARYGGEEFVAVLPNTKKRQARLIAEKLRATIEKTLGGITASFGVATYPNNGKTSETLLKNADHCLYLAKEKGRNCVIAADRDFTIAS